MIMLLDDTYQTIKTVNTHDQLFLYLQESLKKGDEQEKQDWNFSQYSHKLLAPFVKEMRRKSFVHMAWQACQQENDLIVMTTGDMENCSFFIATPDLDLAALRKEWCVRYCKANKMYIITQ